MEKKKIILDCDPGIDDALALMPALSSPELHICGITTVCGNVPAELGADNVLRVLQFMNRPDIPVYRGAEKPLARRYISAQDTHGEDGLGESGIPPTKGASWHSGAVDFILDTLHQTEALTIVALGPLTNLALALRKKQNAFQNLGRLTPPARFLRIWGNRSIWSASTSPARSF